MTASPPILDACRSGRLEELSRLVEEQAEDGDLWFVAETITEDILQCALRELHAAVEAFIGPCPAKDDDNAA